MSEIIIEVDENNKVIGKRPRDDFYTGKYIHRSSFLLLFNSNNELLIQKRTMSKRWYPGLYTYSVAGTVGDESYEECIEREMKEEIGLELPFKKLFTFKYLDKLDKAFGTIFMSNSDKPVNVDEKEVESYKWDSLTELKEDMLKKSEIYTYSFLEGMKIYFKKYHESTRN